jgi:signal transduction histidine kinase
MAPSGSSPSSNVRPRRKGSDLSTAFHPDERHCDANEIRSLFLFEGLDEAQLAQVCAGGRIDTAAPGPIVEEGQPASTFYVLLDGEIVVSKRSGERDIDTNRTTHRGTFFGAVASFLDTPPPVYTFSVRALTPCRLLTLDATVFRNFMRGEFPIAVHLLQGMWGDHEGMHSTIDYQNRIKAAGTIAAGLAHGLNNPAAATVRAAADLRERLHRLTGPAAPSVAAHSALESTRVALTRRIAERAHRPVHAQRSALQIAQTEDEVADWLDAHDVAQAWDVAPVLVAAGVEVTDLQTVLDSLDGADCPDSLGAVLAWLADVLDAETLIGDIAEAGERISELVDASKHYAHLDGSAFDIVDLHRLLDSTLDVLAPALGEDITVVRDYDPTLPGVPCYPGELAQALTHVIANAIEAMRSGPAAGRTLTLRTRLADAVLVEIGDSGPGIDPTIRDHVFDPFFTTKPVGEGAGLGLTVAWRIVVTRHGGTLGVTSIPGDTRFTLGLCPAHVEAC